MVHSHILVKSRERFRHSHGINTVYYILLLCAPAVAPDWLNLIDYTNTKKLLNQQGKVSESEVRELSLSGFMSESVSESMSVVPKMPCPKMPCPNTCPCPPISGAHLEVNFYFKLISIVINILAISYDH